MKTSTILALSMLVVVTSLDCFTQHAAAACIIPNVGGTGELPPVGCEYVPPTGDVMESLPPALPAGATIEYNPTLNNFFAITEVPGGSLGGDTQNYSAVLELEVEGTGALAGFFRTLFVPVTVETHSAPRIPGNPVQSFVTDMVDIQGSLFGDPDFNSFSIIGGTNNGMPSPGSTTLTRLGPPSSDFQVESFFDITYQIDFQGAPGSILDGLGGRTDGMIRLQIGNPIPEPATGALAALALTGVTTLRRRKG